MPLICPAILADSAQVYKAEIDKVAGFAHRLQIDLTDGVFAEHKTVKPEEAWWPVGVRADIHLMFQEPVHVTKDLVRHKPHMIIIHAECNGDFDEFAGLCRLAGVKIGVALLPQTSPEMILPKLEHIDHVLIFSGNLGEYGGSADLRLLPKAEYLKARKPNLEIGWDGGVNAQNVSQLVFGGVDVLNAGGFIQNAQDPHQAFQILERIADETGTT